VGGMVANNATGAHSILYGMTGDQLLAAEVILADASRATFSATEAPPALAAACTAIAARHADAIRANFPKTWRRSSGYSINQLLLSPTPRHPHSPFSSTAQPSLLPLLSGSEGTLALLTRAKLNLVPKPKHTSLCLLQFDSIQQAAEATPTILEHHPSAVELLSRMIFDLTRAVPAYARLLTWLVGEPAAVLAVEFQGESEAEVLSKIQQLEERHLTRTSTRALTAEQQANVWTVRKAGLGLSMSMRGAAKPVAFMEDVTAPVEHLGEFVREIDRIFAAEGVTQASYYGHASAGCLHIRPVLNLKLQTDVERMRRIASAVFDVVKNLGGAMSGEHGDGLARSCWNERLFGAEVYQAFREIKHAFDPHCLLNPGKIVSAPDFTENLRFGPNYQTLELHPHLDFGADGGFAGAVEQCNGAGACRKEGGVMCPSFHATRDEEHSTRGRANALRATLSGLLPAHALTSHRMHQVLDLCLECKACKAECPSAVDMAKIKYEWLAHYQAQNGVPLRSQIFANIATISSAACQVPRLANAAFAHPTVRWLNEKLLGLSRHRTSPRFANKTFRQQFTSYVSRFTSHAVVLFVDTWTNYNHPEIGHAAVKVLRAAGYEPHVVAHGCCGRPMISKGLLAQAKEAARRNV
jgi:FAD/FMN-containing dehydrogenase